MISSKDALNRIDEKKKKIDAVGPLPAALSKNLQEWLAVKFIYTSSALDGNTLSHSETAIVVEKGIAIGGKTVREHLEITDCARAVDFITARARKKQSVTLNDICTIHTIVSQRMDTSQDFVDFMGWLQDVQDHPVVVAALAHYKLVTIHPFVDGPPSLELWRTAPAEALQESSEALCERGAEAGNGRTARLLMNLLLLQQGYPLAIIKKEQRLEYITAIEHARETENFDAFYTVIISAVEYSLDIYLEAIEQSDLS